MQNLNGNLDEQTLEKIRIKRQDAQKTLILMTRRMKIHQIIYEHVKRDYTKVLKTYQKLDLSYALNTKRTIVPSKTKTKTKITRTRKNIMPNKVRALLNNLPEEARNKIIAAYQ